MVTVRFLIKRYAWDEATETHSGTATLFNAFDVLCSRVIGDKNDIFSFKVNNIRDTYITSSPLIKNMDRVEIYYVINEVPIDENTNLVFNGLVKKVTETLNRGRRVINVSGVSFSEIATTGLVFVTGNEAEGVNVMQLLERAVASIALRNPNFMVTTDLPTNKFNTTTGNYDGDSFPIINAGLAVREFDRSLNFILDKYLTSEYTGDGQYYWFVNNQRQLVVRKKTVGGFSGVLNQGVDFKTVKFDIDVNDVKNFIIVKCGSTPYNKPITAKYDDVVSRGRYGFRYHMIVDTKIAGDLLEEQGFESGSKFPSAYPYVTTWNVSTSSDGDFNSKFKAEVKSRGESRAKKFASSHNIGILKISLTLQPTVAYSVGDRLRINAVSYNLSNKEMRITRVDYDEKSVTIDLEEEVAVG